MAHLPVIPDVWRVAIRHSASSSGDHAVNVVHVRSASLTTNASVAALLDAEIAPNAWAILSNLYNECDLQITKLDGTSATTVEALTSPNWGGGQSGERIMEGAMGLTLYTGTRGKSFRGRVFIGPISEASQSAGQLGSTQVGDVTGAWEQWQTDLETHDAAFVVASYKLRSAADVVNFRGHTNMRTMRPRLLRSRTA